MTKVPKYPLRDLTDEERQRYPDAVKFERYPPGAELSSAKGRLWTKAQLERAKRQRGMADGWMLLAGVVLLVLAVTGLIVAANKHDAAIDAKAYARGKDEMKAEYTQRDNDALRAANAEIQRLQNAARTAEAAHRKALDSVTLKLTQEIRANEKLRIADRDAIRDGTLRLRDPGAVATGTADCRPGPRAAPVASTGGGDGAEAGELSPEFTEFLVSEANRADAIVHQLTAAQALIVEQVKTCNGQ